MAYSIPSWAAYGQPPAMSPQAQQLAALQAAAAAQKARMAGMVPPPPPAQAPAAGMVTPQTGYVGGAPPTMSSVPANSNPSWDNAQPAMDPNARVAQAWDQFPQAISAPVAQGEPSRDPMMAFAMDQAGQNYGGQDAAVPAAAPAAAAQPSFFSRLGSALGDNSHALLGAAGALLSNPGWSGLGPAMQGMSQGNIIDQRQRTLRQAEYERKAKMAALNKYVGAQGISDPAQRSVYQTDPEMAQELFKRNTTPAAPITVAEGGTVIRPTASGGMQEIYRGPDKQTNEMRNAAAMGFPQGSDPYNEFIRTASQRGVNINQPYESQYKRTRGEGAAKSIGTYEQKAADAREILPNLESLKELVTNPKYELSTGWGAEASNSVRSALVSMGMADPGPVASFNTARSLVNQITLKQIGGSLGTAISDGDRKFVERAGMTMDDPKQAMLLKIEFAQRAAKRQQDISRMATEYEEKHGTFNQGKFEQEVAEWAKENSLFPERAVGRIEGAFKPTSAVEGVRQQQKQSGPSPFSPPDANGVRMWGG